MIQEQTPVTSDHLKDVTRYQQAESAARLAWREAVHEKTRVKQMKAALARQRSAMADVLFAQSEPA